MFYDFSQITEMNFSNFVTSHVTNMFSMFQGCVSLKFLDLSSFDTSKVLDMVHIFYGCSSLTSLDLSNFDFTRITFEPCHMFEESPNLKYLNLRNAKLNNFIIPKIQYISLNGITLSDSNSNYNNLINQKNLVINCINNLFDASNINYKYTGYFKTLINNNNKCSFCGSDYYKKEYDSAKTNSYYNCHKELEGYYLDNNELLYKLCYSSCKKCNIKGNITNHNCIECANYFNYGLEDLLYKNCYQICPINKIQKNASTNININQNQNSKIESCIITFDKNSKNNSKYNLSNS